MESSSRIFRNYQERRQHTTGVAYYSSHHKQANKIIFVVHPTLRCTSSQQRRVTPRLALFYHSVHSYYYFPSHSVIFASGTAAREDGRPRWLALSPSEFCLNNIGKVETATVSLFLMVIAEVRQSFFIRRYHFIVAELVIDERKHIGRPTVQDSAS